MSKVDMSPAWIAARMPHLFGNNGAVMRSDDPNNGLLNCAGIYGQAQIALMSGTKPTAVPNAATLATYGQSVLCLFKAGDGGVGNDFAPSTLTTNPVKVATLFKTAFLTGTATWFCWAVAHHVDRVQTFIQNNNSIFNSTGLTVTECIIGTVGMIGSNADLIIEDIDIVSGQDYRISNLQLVIPTKWGY